MPKANKDLLSAANKAFILWMRDDYSFHLKTVKYRGRDVSALKICTLLWNCTDHYDSFEHGLDLYDRIGIHADVEPPLNETYGAYARKIVGIWKTSFEEYRQDLGECERPL